MFQPPSILPLYEFGRLLAKDLNFSLHRTASGPHAALFHLCQTDRSC